MVCHKTNVDHRRLDCGVNVRHGDTVALLKKRVDWWILIFEPPAVCWQVFVTVYGTLYNKRIVVEIKGQATWSGQVYGK